MEFLLSKTQKRRQKEWYFRWRKAEGASVLHKTLQVTEKNWEKWWKRTISCPVPNDQPWKHAQKQHYMDLTGYI